MWTLNLMQLRITLIEEKVQKSLQKPVQDYIKLLLFI